VAVRKGDRVLEIGTGSGYLSACMAHLGGYVRTLELHRELADAARRNLQSAGTAWPVEVLEADGLKLDETGRYDVIVVTASLPIYQPVFERALRPGGRLFVVVGAAVPERAMLIRCAGPNDCSTESLFETVIEALEGAPRPAVFGF
jgi:protein-L-isoaspartate(D-aspartate) O-methyltransferase